jgi:hypothetical protein
MRRDGECRVDARRQSTGAAGTPPMVGWVLVDLRTRILLMNTDWFEPPLRILGAETSKSVKISTISVFKNRRARTLGVARRRHPRAELDCFEKRILGISTISRMSV